MTTPADPLDEYPPLMSPAEVSQCLGIGVRRLAEWRAARVGPSYVKLAPGHSGTVRYPREDVRAFINARRVSCDPQPAVVS